ncbi:MAG: glycoside hydrolase family 2 protein [Candidatus Thorarchaeota archaeon]
MSKSEHGGWKPAESQLYTRWTKDVDPINLLPEYPRPQLVRNDWMNLNGLWEFAVTSKKCDQVSDYQGKILVPYPIESALSGVGRKLTPKENLIYRRFFSIPEGWQGKRIILHFGAVDWESKVYVNGTLIGNHSGGYLSFSFDITDSLNHKEENELRVVVWDPTDKGKQERGKQSLNPKVVFYTAVSGIWQTVWMEPVSDTYVKSVRITPDIDKEHVNIQTEIQGENGSIRIQIVDPNSKSSLVDLEGTSNEDIQLRSLKLWSPASPFLYDLFISVMKDGNVVDEIQSYFAMRKISIDNDANGVPRLALNNEISFQYGPLDQGYWPDGLYTAPTDEALRYDVEIMKELGFNMVRKHVKVEPLRWYHHCDRLGLIVWQDMPNGGNFSALTYKSERNQGRDDAEVREQYVRELEEMINSLYNCPSIVMWIPFNEGWGQFDTERIVEMIQQWDSSRLINEASGWFDKGTGHVADAHNYPDPIMPDVEESRASVLGEFGGLGLLDEHHTWHPGKLFGIKKYYHGFDKSQNEQELTGKYLNLLHDLKELIPKGLAAAIYTQLTDIEGEINGYLTYDREIMKMTKDRIVVAHKELETS